MKRIIAAYLFVVLAVAAARAHEGHVHGPEQDANAPVSGPIALSETTIRNLGVETVEVQPAPLQRTLRMAARIQGLPERQAKISPRAEGRVAEILVKLGDNVTAGQPLLRFDPLAVGNPRVTLNAPISGRIVRQDASLGQSLTPDAALMEVADYSQVLARATTFESPDLSAIKVGQPAHVRLDVFGDEPFAGKVQRLDVALEKESGTFEVYVLLENPDLKLRPNMQATATIGIGEPQEVVAVPQRAVLGDLGNLFVFVQDAQNNFERRNVVIGMKAGDQVEIVEGVLPGDKVVTQGNYQLQFAATGNKTGETVGKPDEMGHEGHDHSGGAEVTSRFHIPGWGWAIGGFALGAFLFGFLLRRAA